MVSKKRSKLWAITRTFLITFLWPYLVEWSFRTVANLLIKRKTLKITGRGDLISNMINLKPNFENSPRKH